MSILVLLRGTLIQLIAALLKCGTQLVKKLMLMMPDEYMMGQHFCIFDEPQEEVEEVIVEDEE